MSNPQADPQLPTVPTSLTGDEVRSRLKAMSKRGKLPGFEPEEPGALCSVAAHGTPFDSKLLIRIDGGDLSFECEMNRLMPCIFAVLLVVTVWPGLPLTSTFLTSFDWYNSIMASIGIQTWHWYLPLTILPVPFAFRSALMKSRRSAHESALEAIEKVRSVL
ncbi:MAG: hypothetical protein KDA29_01460 [Phycisphaerales bacterium]|nr:hypothetical protein [Phycisphaerales bacterium]